MDKTANNPHLPVTKAERIVSIDVLRGFALLGILVMNIVSFGLIDSKYMNPMAQGELSTVSYICWWLSHVFFDSKFMALFSILFGAGIVLMWERARDAGRKTTWLHYRRMFWLLLFGLAHAHLLWVGDILYTYALCGMLVYWLCGLRARWLFPIGLLLLLVGSGIALLLGFSIDYMSEADHAEFQKSWSPNAEQVAESLAIYRGSWLEQLPHRSMTALMMETFLFLFSFLWRAGGLMLIGMGLYKLKTFDASRSTKFYTWGAILSFAIGIPLILIGIHFHEANDWHYTYSFFLGPQFNYWGSIPVAFGYVCIVMVCCKLELFTWLRTSLAAVGQMALTNYLMHTVICTTIFYGHGLGWFGYLKRVQLLGIVIAIWILQLVVSPIWLKHFRFGPFEWLWRSLTYWRFQPLKRVEKEPTVAAKAQ